MVDLRDALDSGDSAVPLEPVRLGQDPVLLLLFTADADETRLHYIDDAEVRAFVPCPGEACPVCYGGQHPQRFFLLPVVDVEARAIKILRIASKRGPATLADQLLPHMREPASLVDTLFLISRDGARHTVQTSPLADNASRCEEVVKAFVDARSEGLDLLSAFPRLTAKELAQVESVHRRIEAVGGWTPPDSELSVDQ